MSPGILIQDKTVLVIAHRLRSVRYCDKIIVLDKGSIHESGTHDELMKMEQGLYRHLLKLQQQSANWQVNTRRLIKGMASSVPTFFCIRRNIDHGVLNIHCRWGTSLSTLKSGHLP